MAFNSTFLLTIALLIVCAHCSQNKLPEQFIRTISPIESLASIYLLRNGLYASSIADYSTDFEDARLLSSLIGEAAAGPSFRQLGIINGIFNPLSSSRPTVASNTSPSLSNSLRSSSTCTGNSNGESGVCITQSACSQLEGQASGPCAFNRICCVNKISTCSRTTTVNTTYFESPSTLDGPLSCTLTVKLNERLSEQQLPVCQLRLDFVSFTIAQPAPGGTTIELQSEATNCLTDYFQVAGTLNSVPTICGDNSGQHMYLHVPPSNKKPSDVKLTFHIGAATVSRSWKIKISMLPCGTNYLAPPDCLQYLTSTSGRVSSFNWADVAAAGARQLANQDYRVCFRSEVLDKKKTSKRICFTECPVSNGGDAFLVSTLGEATDAALARPSQCPDDYLRIANGVNEADNAAADRFCGNFLGAGGTETASQTVCSNAQPYAVHYVTDNAEGFVGEAGTEAKNTGFCLSFQLQ